MEIINKYFKDLSPLQEAQFSRLDGLYRDWNAKINVLSRKDMDALYERHVLHALSIARVVDPVGLKIVDIGTGGGFPGIPLAIFFPEAEFVLLDSIGKKIRVVNAVAEALGLANVRTAALRAEAFPERDFDLAVSRAVAPLEVVGRWARVILKSRNRGLICLKGGDLEAEIRASAFRVRTWALKDMFEESFFETKQIVWASLSSQPPG